MHVCTNFNITRKTVTIKEVYCRIIRSLTICETQIKQFKEIDANT